MRWLAIVIMALGTLWAAAAAAQPPRYFYCYAQDPQTRIVYVSDAHDVGPVSERASYGSDFSRFLSAKGKIPSGAPAYCTMQPTKADIDRGIADLAQYCSGCSGPSGFEDIVWPRGGKTVANLLVGRLASSVPNRAPPNGEPLPVDEPAEGVGVFMLGRLDQTDVVFTANEENGQMLTRYKADLRGGKWTTILSNDRCPGWLAIAYASTVTERAYFVSRGAADEGAASRAALAKAEDYAARKGSDWNSGVLYAFSNEYRAPGLDFARGPIEAAKGKVGQLVTRYCNDAGAPVGGARG